MSDYITLPHADRFLKIIKCMCELYIIMHLHAFVYDRMQPLVNNLSSDYISCAKESARSRLFHNRVLHTPSQNPIAIKAWYKSFNEKSFWK